MLQPVEDDLLSPDFRDASVAQLVEHHLAKVNVEGSNPFARSIFSFNDLQKSHPELPQKVTTHAAIFDGIFDV